MLDRCKHYWKEFAESTGFYNFAFLFKSKTKVECAFWLLATVIGALFTVNDVRGTIEHYWKFPTATRIKVHNNDSMELSGVAICIDFDVSRMIPEHFNITDMSQISEILENAENFNLIQYFHEYHIHEKNTTKIGNLKVLLGLVLGAISSIVRAEQMINHNTSYHRWGFPISITKSSMPRVLNKSSAQPIRIMHQWLKNRYSYADLMQSAGRFMCHLMKQTVITNSFGNDQYVRQESDPCNNGLITWLGVPLQNLVENEVFCMKLHTDYFRYKTPADTTLFSLKPQDIYPHLHKFIPARYVYLSLHDAFLSLNGHNIQYIPFESAIFLSITVVGQYTELNTDTDPCAKIPSQVCLMKCRSEFIKNACKCRPLSQAYLSMNEISLLPYCGNSIAAEEKFVLRQSSDCLSVGMKFQPNQTCADRCLSPCQTLLYSVTSVWDETLRSLMDFETDDKSTVFGVSFDLFKYPVIEEIPLMTVKDFFTNLGGNLSLYLGVSFIVILHFFIFFMNVIFTEIRIVTGRSQTKMSTKIDGLPKGTQM